jgi:protein phosphatase
MSLALRYAARSDVGLRRDGNEDSMYVGPRLLAIADGMGGQAAGEVASSIVIATLAPLDEDIPSSDLLGELAAATRAANEYLRDMVKSDRELEGMGTTLTAMLVDGGRVGLVHIGDSRGYLLRDGELTQITHDHSLVQTLVDEGRISADEASHHPQRSLILRALDGRDDLDPDFSVRELRRGDRYLLCTDGLSDVVTEVTIRETLADADSPEQAVERLIDLALRGGGPDNITCVVADVVEEGGSHNVLVGGAAAASDVRDGPTPDTPAGRAALAERASSRPREHDQPASGASASAHRPAHTKRTVGILVGVVLLLAAGAVGGWLYVRAQYFVGEDNSHVAILRGVSGSVLGVSLHSVHSRSPIPIDQLPQYERERVRDGINAASLTDAQRIVDRLRSEEACPTTGPLPPPGDISATPSSAPSTGASSAAAASPSPTPSPSAASAGCDGAVR